MEQLVEKYDRKLVAAGLAEPGAPLLAGRDAEIVWNRDDADCGELQKLFDRLNINALLFTRPAEPYRSLVDFLAAGAGEAIEPSDCETRTFLHDLPVVREFDAGAIAAALKHRKSAIVPGRGVVTTGSVSPEQAFVTFSSVCFACFVKFFTDALTAARAGELTGQREELLQRAAGQLDPLPEAPPELMAGPFDGEQQVYDALDEAGRLTVDHHLVDSYFGNISYRFRQTLYISQTTSSLDELAGHVDPVPLDGSSCAGITASSELTAHREVVQTTENRAVLHGHPKFAVILSMDCDRKGCRFVGRCHVRCPYERFLGDVPIVPGEVGTGPTGLCHTLPPAMKGRRGVIVYGHGLFTVGRTDFNEAFGHLLDVERFCRAEYFRRVGG